MLSNLTFRLQLTLFTRNLLCHGLRKSTHICSSLGSAVSCCEKAGHHLRCNYPETHNFNLARLHLLSTNECFLAGVQSVQRYRHALPYLIWPKSPTISYLFCNTLEPSMMHHKLPKGIFQTLLWKLPHLYSVEYGVFSNVFSTVSLLSLRGMAALAPCGALALP